MAHYLAWRSSKSDDVSGQVGGNDMMFTRHQSRFSIHRLSHTIQENPVTQRHSCIITSHYTLHQLGEPTINAVPKTLRPRLLHHAQLDQSLPDHILGHRCPSIKVQPIELFKLLASVG